MPSNDWVRDVYECHRGLLFRVAWLVLRRGDLAEDAVHTAFSRIVGSRPQLNGNAKGYVLQAVRNAAIDLRRQLMRRPMERLDDWEQIPGTESASQHLSEPLAAVSEELDRLDTPTQEIIHLHIHQRMTFREIGELTGAPLQTVASRYRRGLKQIEERIRSDDRPD